MNKAIRKHEKYVLSEIDKLHNADSKHDSSVTKARLRELYEYHVAAVRDFQHERLIHLFVTLFFAWLFIISAAAFVMTALEPISDVRLPYVILFISLMLMITELAYIRHYFLLENGVQGLYKLSKQLHELISR